MIIAVQTLIYYRQSIFKALHDIFRPYYKSVSLSLVGLGPAKEEIDDEEVFADFDDEKGVVFFPPVYLQRYAAVSDCLMDERWAGKLEKIVDLGYHDMSFIRYLKDVPGVKCIYGVDLESVSLRCSSNLFSQDTNIKRNVPLNIVLFEGNAADPDYRLIGCDAVVAIEMIEHMLPHDLERLVHTIFGFIRPLVTIISTPNSDFNVLFPNLGENGFRRWDHFFEWSRQQFNDWCSNIVVRYPQFTVTCKGVGPGPVGTSHLGCCSQMAIFVNKDYHKQKDLDLNSLALVANKEPKPLSDIMGWDSPVHAVDINSFSTDTFPSLTDVMIQSSQNTFNLSLSRNPSEFSFDHKTVQCDLELEIGKNFLMINEEDIYRILIPRRRSTNSVYEFEDVCNRLNCSTFQVTKFSKEAQNLITKNREESVMHTRKVVDDIRHLTKIVKLDDNDTIGESTIWSNINWGENAPYWNQYYKIVKQYNYPFEAKTDVLILDALTEEISRLVDIQCEEELVLSSEANTIRIPIQQLMRVVKHITDDVNMVKDILEWNGYDVQGDMVVHSRLISDDTRTASEEGWEDPVSDNEGDFSTSDGSLSAWIYYGRCLRRALYCKVRKLRSMLALDNDMSVELDKVVCRLMALTISNSTPAPPPSQWMQWKLFDLLTLAERAVERRNAKYIENYRFSAGDTVSDAVNIQKCLPMVDDEASRIVERYKHLVESDDNEKCKETQKDFNVEASKESTEIDSSSNVKSPEKSLKSVNAEITDVHPKVDGSCQDFTFLREEIIYGLQNMYLSSKKNTITKIKDNSDLKQSDSKKSLSNLNKNTSNKHLKMVARKKSIKTFAKNHKDQIISECSFAIASKKSFRRCNRKQTAQSTPIPETYYEIFTSRTITEQNLTEGSDLNYAEKDIEISNNVSSISETKESVIIDFVTEEKTETIAMRRTIGTDADDESDEKEIEPYILNRNDSYCNTFNAEKHINSETIFIHDINEPSTSKGIRHVGLDVQCGSDSSLNLPHSLTNNTECIRCNNSLQTSSCCNNTHNMGTGTDNHNNVFKSSKPTVNSIGIIIKDSDTAFSNPVENSTLPDAHEQNSFNNKKLDKDELEMETLTIKPVLSGKINDLESVIDDTESVMSLAKCDLEPTIYKNVEVESVPSTKRIRSKLSCGAVHVHSYRNRQETEDIMYQGEWQRHSPPPSFHIKNKEKKDAFKMAELKFPKKPSIHEQTLHKKIFKENKFEVKKLANNVIDEKIKETKKIKKQILDTEKKNVRKYKSKGSELNNLNKVKRSVTKVMSKISINSTLPKNKRKVYNPSFSLTEKPKPDNYRNKRGQVPAYLKRIKKELEEQKTMLNESDCSSKTVVLNKSDVEKSLDTVVNKDMISDLELIELSKLQLIDREEKESQIDKMTINEHIFTKETEPSIINFIETSTNYFVFRNEIENKSCSTECESDSISKDENNVKTRIPSPCSVNSSTCSSPDSFSTVIANSVKPVSPVVKTSNCSTKKNSSFFKKDSDNLKTKKIMKKVKLNKKSVEDKTKEDKENIPESSKLSRFSKKVVDKLAKDKNKKGFTLSIPPSNLSKPEKADRLSNKPIANIDDVSTTSTSNTSETINPTDTKTLNMISSEISNPVINKESHKTHGICHNSLNNNLLQLENKSSRTLKVDDRESIMNWMTSSSTNSTYNFDLWEADIQNEKFEIVGGSTKKEESNFTASDELLKQAYNCGLISSDILKNCSKQCCSNTKSSAYESDVTSYKSISSLSEFVMAESDPERLGEGQPACTSFQTSIPVCDIYERKEPKCVQLNATVGSLAVQAFSGFSMNAEPVAGDKADPVNLVDSETGSRAHMFRQSTSEEIYVSGRSDDSFETCTLPDEDIVVPSWLFQFISQQQEENGPADEDLPIAEPEYDVNGNVAEAPRVDTGGGDGRGVHSDPSHDSSGRGSSLTTTSSSDPQSDIAVLDPSLYTQDTSGIQITLPTILIDSPDTFNGIEIDSELPPPELNDVVNQTLMTSDGDDADISSVDTIDATDSDFY